MDIKKCDMCGKDLKSAFSSSEQNEGKEQAKSFVEIRVLSNYRVGEDNVKIFELCESCHYQLLDFVEHSVPIYSTIANEEKPKNKKTKWGQKLKCIFKRKK